MFLDGKAMEERSRNEIARRMAILMTARMEPELMTCRDVVSSGRYPYTGRLGILQPEDQAIVERSLEQVGGMEFADRPFSAISDGQRQRILLARALCQEPEIIVLDEPTSFLDIRYKLELLTVLKRMVRENDLAVLLSLHELELAERISDTVVCVAGDRIDRIGTGWSTGSTTPASTAWNLCRKECYHGKTRCFLRRQRGSRRPGAADPAGVPGLDGVRRGGRSPDEVRADAGAGHRRRCCG